MAATKVIGLTGGVGMGKSTSSSLMEERGWPIVDTDLLARELVRPGQPAGQEIAEAFGAEMLDAEGRLRRDELAQRVFANDDERRKLEAILHPRIRDRWTARVEEWRQAGLPVGVVVIPLLFETGAQGCFDRIVCVACSSQVQHERLRERHWDETQITQRIGAQWPIDEKMNQSDYVIWTDGSLALHAEQVEVIMTRL